VGVSSPTDDLSAALETHREQIRRMQEQLPYPQNAFGIAVAIGDTVVSIDIFDRPTTLARIWGRFVEGIALDALEVGAEECQATGTSVAARLYAAKEMRWERTDSAGLGELYLAQDGEMLATALVVDGTLLHLSVSMPFTK
jgi:hypothetical protein